MDRVEIQALLGKGPDPPELEAVTPRQAVKMLMPLLCSPRAIIRNRAAEALGKAVARWARRDAGAADNIMRRFMWMMNEESGGIGWGVTPAMAWAMVHDRGLAERFAHVLVSFIVVDGAFLEHEPLQEEAAWAIGLLAERRPAVVSHAGVHLAALLGSPSPGVRGLAARALGRLPTGQAAAGLERLVGDRAEIAVYQNGEMKTESVSALAAQALAAAKTGTGP